MSDTVKWKACNYQLRSSKLNSMTVERNPSANNILTEALLVPVNTLVESGERNVEDTNAVHSKQLAERHISVTKWSTSTTECSPSYRFLDMACYFIKIFEMGFKFS